MQKDDIKRLSNDPDGLISYEYLANNIDNPSADINMIVDNLCRVDLTGQFSASAARYLHAIDGKKYADIISRLVSHTIDKDREHAYLPSLLTGLYGQDCLERAAELSAADDNFRRIHKRLYDTRF